MTHIRSAALRHDLGATLWRISVTQDNDEIPDLSLEQLRDFVRLYPEQTRQRAEIEKLITWKEGAQ